MKLLICITLVALASALSASAEQQRILRRVIKSTPTATNLGRIRLVTVRSPSSSAEKGAVSEISSKEAANFGLRSSNETTTTTSSQQQQQGALKSKLAPSTTTTTTAAPSTTSLPSTTTTAAAAAASASTTSTTSKSSSSEPELKNKASERQQQGGARTEVELLAGAPSSWQTMTAVEAPAAMLIAAGTRAAAGDLTQSGSSIHEESSVSDSSSSSSSSDFLRASASGSVKGGSYTQQQQQSVGETFSRIRQQGTKQAAQQFFYPPQQQIKQAPQPIGKTSQYQATKTHWYQPSTTTTPRPAPIIQQQQQEQQYEQQQSEQYVEQQQQQVEYGAAPLGQAEPFAFDFKTEDNSGNGQYRKEESDKNGVVRGSYGYTDASGIYRHVEYVADQNGFRANIKSNEPGLIGETQPASIQMAEGSAPSTGSQRLSAPVSFGGSGSSSNSGADNGEWIAASASNNQGSSSADLALAPPDFESSHKAERLRTPRHFRN